MITQLAENIWKIKTKFLDANVYFVDIDVPTLIDLGYYDDAHIIIEDLESIGYSREDIERVIFTHLHADHAGNPKEFPKARYYASYQEIRNVKSMKMLFTYDSKSADVLDEIKLEPLKGKVGPFEVIATPGHTSGSICLYLEEENFLFTGDTLFGRHTGRTDVPTGSERELRVSLGKLEKFKAKLLPGHDYG